MPLVSTAGLASRPAPTCPPTPSRHLTSAPNPPGTATPVLRLVLGARRHLGPGRPRQHPARRRLAIRLPQRAKRDRLRRGGQLPGACRRWAVCMGRCGVCGASTAEDPSRTLSLPLRLPCDSRRADGTLWSTNTLPRCGRGGWCSGGAWGALAQGGGGVDGCSCCWPRRRAALAASQLTPAVPCFPLLSTVFPMRRATCTRQSTRSATASTSATPAGEGAAKAPRWHC